VVNGIEACDGTKFKNGSTCLTEGFIGGTLGCHPTKCTIDTSTCSWVVSGGGSNQDHLYAMGVDGSGNVVVAGDFQGNMTLGTTKLTSKGSSDVWVAKLDPTGKWLWAVSGGGTNGDSVGGMAVDKAGNIYLTGYFFGSASFGGKSYTSKDTDFFVAKIDPTGKFAWFVAPAGTEHQKGRAVALDSAGNIHVALSLRGSVTLGSTTLSAKSAQVYDVVVAQMTPAGSFNWAAHASGYSFNYSHKSPLGLAVDSNGLGSDL